MSIHAIHVHVLMSVGAITEKRKAAYIESLKPDFPMVDDAQGAAIICRNDIGEQMILAPGQVSYVKSNPVGVDVRIDFNHILSKLNTVIDIPALGLDAVGDKVVFQLEATESGSDLRKFQQRIEGADALDFFSGGLRFILRNPDIGEGEFRVESLVSDTTKTFFLLALQTSVARFDDIPIKGQSILNKFTTVYIPFGKKQFS